MTGAAGPIGYISTGVYGLWRIAIFSTNVLCAVSNIVLNRL